MECVASVDATSVVRVWCMPDCSFSEGVASNEFVEYGGVTDRDPMGDDG